MIYNLLNNAKTDNGLFAILIDPDKYTDNGLEQISNNANRCKADLFLLGGSLLKTNIERTLKFLKSQSQIPIVLFPGSALQYVPGADAILLLSLISGRNPDFLIGHHVLIANSLKESAMEIIPTGYILINDGNPTSVQYMSNTFPIPSSKPDIALATALAGYQLGLKTIYLEAGSGANNPVPTSTIRLIKNNIDIPIIVGGGLKTPQQVKAVREAGASMVVVGNFLESNPNDLADMVEASR